MNSSISPLAKNAITVVVVVLVIFVALRFIRRLLFAMLSRLFPANRATPQWKAFEYRLRDMVLRDPALFMARLCARDRQSFVASLWKEAGWADGRQVTHSIASPDIGPKVDCLRLTDGRPIAVVTLPESTKVHNPILIGVVLPEDERFAQDLARARRAVHYFVLYGFKSERSTDLCEWPVQGRQLTYNIGAPRDPAGFARAVEAKLTELGR
jgi:hypothetical protein